MKAFTVLEGVAAALDRANVDTDQIIPKQFLRKIERSGFGKHLFHDWRFLDDEGTKPNPEFELNKPVFQGANILLAKDNFGCGSSREHAPWALEDYGFRCIIAPSFADIFYNNCFKNGMLPIKLESKFVDELFSIVNSKEGIKFKIDLEKQIIIAEGKEYSFDVDSSRKELLLKGLDDIALTLVHEAEITKFENKNKQDMNWLYA
ncbi:MAG: 3-isopropylmalate dehydratase small subunit [Leptospiraceae bacterium]|nr:3-isopropylmalate dehydratase small subunit [Leptospiraceae bacterium]